MSQKIFFALVAFFSLFGCAFGAETPQDTATYVKMVTNKGSIEIRLYDETPIHRDNFIRLVREQAYDKVIFHRVIKQFMIQAGGNVLKGDSLSAAKLEEKHSALLPAEIVYPKFFHKYGALAAARTGDDVNPEKKSSSFQFYIVTGKCYLDSDIKKHENAKNITFTDEIKETYKTEGGTPHLDMNYTVFGEVVKGMNTVEKIQSVQTDAVDQPVSPVYIKKVVILKKKKK
ncbi:MAG: peptidylprolyl isomerase [Porphyromonas sp.]|nr:peptidylprolyl isomerase [Porphyromonas sp.]